MINNNITYYLTLFCSGLAGISIKVNFHSIGVEIITRAIVTTVALLIASTIVFFYKRFLDKKFKNK